MKRRLQDRPPLIFATSASGSTPYLRGSVVGRRVGYSTSSRVRARNLREVKRCMRRLAELKHSTTQTTQAPTTTAWNAISLSVLSQGTSASTRIGQQIGVASIQFKGTISAAPATQGDKVRVVVTVDSESAGANPGSSVVFETNDVNSNYNLDCVGPGKRLRVLMDKTYIVVPTAASVTDGFRDVQGRIKVDFNTFYQSNAGTISDVLKNNITVWIASEKGVANQVINWQMCYTDV